MGTNFYFADRPDDPGFEDDPEFHVGKRSAHSLYCWDCKVVLPVRTKWVGRFDIEESVDRCPKCGGVQRSEGLEHSTVGRELGFNKSQPESKSGVASCSVFDWACTAEDFERRISEQTATEPIIDEYGRGYTLEAFNAVLSECPAQEYDMVGQIFC